jgi:hypothetical protein
VALILNLLVAVWLFSPQLSPHRGVDSRVFYAAGKVAASGGNPYDPAVFLPAQERIFDQPSGYQRTDDAYVYPHTYANPPLFTAALRTAAVVPWPVFFWAGVALALGASLIAFELLLDVLRWRGRALPRLAFLLSAPVLIEAFFGNTSALLLLAWSVGLWLMSRDRPALGGVVLALCWIKPTVGLLVVGALLVAGPGRRVVAAAGFAAGSLLLLVASIAVTGTRPLIDWAHALTGYGLALTGGSVGSFGENISGLAGVTSLLMGPLGRGAGIVVSALLLAGLLAWLLLTRSSATALRTDPQLRLALLMGMALGFSPYLHFNDLVLAAFPLLVIASRPLTAATRVALGGWGLIFPARLAVLEVISLATHSPGVAPSWWNLLAAFGGPAGIGAWLSLLLLVGLVGAVMGPRMSPVAAGAAAGAGRRPPPLPA